MTTKVKKQPRCSICRKIPKLDCDYRQGRCPHRPSVLDQISTETRTRFQNLIKFFTGKK